VLLYVYFDLINFCRCIVPLFQFGHGHLRLKLDAAEDFNVCNNRWIFWARTGLMPMWVLHCLERSQCGGKC